MKIQTQEQNMREIELLHEAIKSKTFANILAIEKFMKDISIVLCGDINPEILPFVRDWKKDFFNQIKKAYRYDADIYEDLL
jgi:hypothetical protein